MEVLAQSRYLSFRLKPEHTALQLWESVRVCMHRADGMLGVNYSGTGCGHVCSGMCAAVEASPSAQIVAHLSNCLQDLNAALLLRKREAIIFSMVGGGGAQEGPGQHALSSLLALKCAVDTELLAIVWRSLPSTKRFDVIASILYNALFVDLLLPTCVIASLVISSSFHPYFLFSCYFCLSHDKEFWKMCLFSMPNFLFLFISYPHIIR